ncbi:MAG: ATP-binding protein [Bacteroidia bacterium]|nr:ATP-binding protein [Bacteroidia bacterium]
MIIKSFRFNIVIRVIFLALAVFVFEFVWEQNNWPMTKLFFAAAIVGLVLELIRYVEKTNRDLQNFLMAIKHKDFTQTFTSEKRGKSFIGLKDAFNQIIKGYQDLRAEKETHYQYLQNVIEHVSVALLCYSKEGEIMLMNRAASELLDRPYMSNIRILSRVNEELMNAVKEIESGEKKLVKVVINEEMKHLAIQATEFKLQDTGYKLVSFQDIRSELDEKEVETWQKLIRVLTHEIMNSVTPIISLAKVVNTLMTDEKGARKPLAEVDEDDADDILNSVQTIESRSKGLLHFVHAYRNLTRIQKPNFKTVVIGDMIRRVESLLRPEFDKRNVGLTITLPEAGISIQGDAELLEQVLINLVKNALEAVEGIAAPKVEIALFGISDHKPIIQVKDNGQGIDNEYIDKIFIPFFTTKKKGSGIGLSLSLQIMRMHKGSINFQTTPGEGTSFTLNF